MSGKRDGGLADALQLERAVAQLAEQGASAEEIQLGLFSGGSVFGTIRTPEGGELARSGPGRPRGSRNRTTRDLVKLIEGHGRHPVIAMAEIVATPIDVLAKTLGCKKIEAAEYHRKVMADLAPYVAQKLPTAVQVQGANAGLLVINTGAPVDKAAIVGLAMQVVQGGQWPLIDGEENQGVSGETGDPSHAAPSHGEGK
jgi:hypothetical protein